MAGSQSRSVFMWWSNSLSACSEEAKEILLSHGKVDLSDITVRPHHGRRCSSPGGFTCRRPVIPPSGSQLSAFSFIGNGVKGCTLPIRQHSFAEVRQTFMVHTSPSISFRPAQDTDGGTRLYLITKESCRLPAVNRVWTPQFVYK